MLSFYWIIGHKEFYLVHMFFRYCKLPIKTSIYDSSLLLGNIFSKPVHKIWIIFKAKKNHVEPLDNLSLSMSMIYDYKKIVLETRELYTCNEWGQKVRMIYVHRGEKLSSHLSRTVTVFVTCFCQDTTISPYKVGMNIKFICSYAFSFTIPFPIIANNSKPLIL